MYPRVVLHHRYPLAVNEDAQNPCLGGQFLEAGELGGTGVDKLAEHGEIGMGVLAGGGIGLRPTALFGHQFAETELVHRQPRLGRHLQREFDREAVRVVQRKCVRPGQLGLTG